MNLSCHCTGWWHRYCHPVGSGYRRCNGWQAAIVVDGHCNSKMCYRGRALWASIRHRWLPLSLDGPSTAAFDWATTSRATAAVVLDEDFSHFPFFFLKTPNLVHKGGGDLHVVCKIQNFKNGLMRRDIGSKLVYSSYIYPEVWWNCKALFFF